MHIAYNVGKTIIKHPPNHHKLVVKTIITIPTLVFIFVLPTLQGFLPSHEPRNNAEQRAAKGFSIRAGEALASQRWLLGELAWDCLY
jgi:hypothetical protein